MKNLKALATNFNFKTVLFLMLVVCGGCYSLTSQAIQSIQTERLCVFYDAGETTSLMPVLKKWEREGKDFRVLVLATAETLIKPGMFEGKRLVLQDLGIDEGIDTKTPRTQPLSEKTLKKLSAINPQLVLVGTASKVQEQVLEHFSQSTGVAFIDNFNYDPSFTESFSTVKAVQSAAKYVLCPSKNLIDLFKEDNQPYPVYYIVGKPSLEVWEEEIQRVNRSDALEQVGLKEDGGPVVTFIGGYGAGYDVINPLFAQCAKTLRESGYQVIIQSHPKVEPQKIKVIEALAISDYVVGYNSSVVFDAAVIGKNALYMIPNDIPFYHFAIEEGLIEKVPDCEGLMNYIKEGKAPSNLRKALNIPDNSVEEISNLIDRFL